VAKYDRLLELVEEHCTIDQIKDILRFGLGNKNVKLSADDKAELVQKNLRGALNSHSLDVERVYDGLRDAEENAPQRIYYLRCPSKDVQQLLTLPYIRETLLGKGASDEPNLYVKPNSIAISEVRAVGKAKPHDWIVKFYGHDVREVATGEVIRESATRILKVYRPEDFRYVLLARWNAPDLIEFRTPRDSSNERVDAWRIYLEKMLGVAVPLQRFSPWSLKLTNERLFNEKDKHAKIYKLGDAELEDEYHNKVRFQSYLPNADLFGTAATGSAAKGMLDNNSTYNQQRVIWLKQQDQGFTTDISTMIGARHENEIVVSKHQNAKGIDYVTRQLRAFSKS
jgi:hypothetical protein